MLGHNEARVIHTDTHFADVQAQVAAISHCPQLLAASALVPSLLGVQTRILAPNCRIRAVVKQPVHRRWLKKSSAPAR